jgi:hypothetical protein
MTAFLPKHILRLCALGTLLQKDRMTYRELAVSVRDFSSHLAGPSLDLMGSSMELLRYEGLITAVDQPQAQTSSSDDSVLTVTEHGHSEFVTLMTTPTELILGDHTKLVMTLKVRFLHLLSADLQASQAQELAAHYQQALDKLHVLKARYEKEPGNLSAWLEHDIAQTQRRLSWFVGLQEVVRPDGAAATTGPAHNSDCNVRRPGT